MKTARIGILSSLTGNSICDITAGLFHTKYRQNVQLILYHSTLGDTVEKVKEGILRSLDFIIFQNWNQTYLDELYITRGGAESDLILLYQDKQIYERIAKLYELGVIVNLAIGHAKDSTPELSRFIQNQWLKYRFKFLRKGRLAFWQKLKLFYAPVIFSVPAEVGAKLDRVYRDRRFTLNAVLPVFTIKNQGTQLQYFIQPGFTYNLYLADKYLFSSKNNPEFLASELGLYSLWYSNKISISVPNLLISEYIRSTNKTFNFFSVLMIISLLLNNEQELRKIANKLIDPNNSVRWDVLRVDNSAATDILFPHTSNLTELFYRLNKLSRRGKLSPKSKLVNPMRAFYEKQLLVDKLALKQAFNIEITSKEKTERLRVILAELLAIPNFENSIEREIFLRYGIDFAQKYLFIAEKSPADNLSWKELLKTFYQSLLKFTLLFSFFYLIISLLAWFGK